MEFYKIIKVSICFFVGVVVLGAVALQFLDGYSDFIENFFYRTQREVFISGVSGLSMASCLFGAAFAEIFPRVGLVRRVMNVVMVYVVYSFAFAIARPELLLSTPLLIAALIVYLKAEYFSISMKVISYSTLEKWLFGFVFVKIKAALAVLGMILFVLYGGRGNDLLLSLNVLYFSVLAWVYFSSVLSGSRFVVKN